MRINKYIKFSVSCLLLAMLLSSCEKKLEEITYDEYGASSFFTSATDANSALTAMYAGMLESGAYGGGWGASNQGWVAQSSMETDELVCSWGWDGWTKFNELNFSEDFDELLNHYNYLMPIVSEITIDISKIEGIDMDEDEKAYDIAQLKALRAHYSWILYNFYGPVSVIRDPEVAANPDADPVARPSSDSMVAWIERDYNEAIPDLLTCASLPSEDYGRFTQDACLMGLMKLYMHEKRWSDVISTGEKLMTYGHTLQSNYEDIFTYDNKGNSDEIILAISCRKDADINYNLWLAMVMPGNYVDPNGYNITQWNGYKMPWETYDKFDTANDKRLDVLLESWPTSSGTYNGRENGYIGAIPMKYGPDPSASSEQQGTDIVVWRYADVLLMMAEAINEYEGPVSTAYNYINQVRARAGVTEYATGEFTQDEFRDKIVDERLFELWGEGCRREDMIRWGTFISRAQQAGSIYANDDFVLYPIPRTAITESNGVIEQNPGY
ncbi:RagB/SusD family nutrient uptake outer membrane protein [Parafilimonas sp.]|uniref:RagB/SusD family nutrient uptake outer membrane protein n=1 Tax=Parafilimonas sp. TaxID=1969739 RepID=UPI0039E3E6F7